MVSIVSSSMGLCSLVFGPMFSFVHKTSSVFSARVLLLVRLENSYRRIHHSEKHLMQINLRSMKFVGCWLAITGFPWKQYIPVSEDGASFTFSSNSAHSPPQTTRN
ncbi:hypothetical protein ACOSQ4_029871 [Xanthoceras sorbifolium]